MIWEVADVFKGTDGRPYVELVRVGDRSLRKTLAAAALGQSNQYVPGLKSPVSVNSF